MAVEKFTPESVDLNVAFRLRGLICSLARRMTGIRPAYGRLRKGSKNGGCAANGRIVRRADYWNCLVRAGLDRVPPPSGKGKVGFEKGVSNLSKEIPMSMNVQPQPDRPDPSVIAAQNDAFRKLACLGVPPAQPI